MLGFDLDFKGDFKGSRLRFVFFYIIARAINKYNEAVYSIAVNITVKSLSKL